MSSRKLKKLAAEYDAALKALDDPHCKTNEQIDAASARADAIAYRILDLPGADRATLRLKAYIAIRAEAISGAIQKLGADALAAIFHDLGVPEDQLDLGDWGSL
jgi:hypothetical protein